MINDILPDIPRAFTAIAEWLACLLQILLLKKRFHTGKTVVIAVLWLSVQSAFLILTDNVSNWFWLICMLAAIGMMFLFLWICCKEGVKRLICCCTKAFLLAELIASFEWQLYCFLISYFMIPQFACVPFCILLYLICFCAVFRFEKKLRQNTIRRTTSLNEMGWTLLIGGASFLFSNISFTTVISPFSGTVSYDIFYIRTLVNIGGLAILYAFQGYSNELAILKELVIIDHLYKSQYEKYMQFQKDMDFINIKYHDLKHQIKILQSQKGSEELPGFLDEMEREIDEHNIFLSTGNSILDTILSEKMAVCKQNLIDITYMVDGSLLHFMQPGDICSIFGNALDNAIESACLVEDYSKRLINVILKRNCGCVYILIKNYTENEIHLESNPFDIKSTKTDQTNHGYGLKSIQKTVKKYEGTCSIEFKDKWFSLKILFHKSAKLEKPTCDKG